MPRKSKVSAMKLSVLAEQLGVECIGDGDLEITGLNSLEEANGSELSFFANPKYADQLKTTQAGAIIVPEEAKEYAANALVSDSPYFDFARAGFIFAKPQGEGQGISPQAYVDESATLGPDCVVYPFAFIGPRVQLGAGCKVFPGAYIGEECILGDNCTVYPNAVLMRDVVVGDDCIFHPGSVVGTDGFGFIRLEGGIQDIPQTGTVFLGDNVVIGANSCVDKAHIGTTRIDNHSKLDNLVQVGHNVHIGEESLLISQVGVAGSTKVGKRATFAGQVGVAGHLKIGDDVTIGAQAGVAANIENGAIGGGSPFMDKSKYSRYLVLASKIPDLFKRVSRLEKTLSGTKPNSEG